MSIMHGIEYTGYVDPWTDEERLSDEEIVRCRDCKHVYEDRRDTATGWVDVFACDSEQWSTVSLMPSHEVDPEGFCAWGERRDE